MTQCQCITTTGKPCTRVSSAKPQDNPIYCWQHQTCNPKSKQKISTPKPITPIKSKVNIAFKLPSPPISVSNITKSPFDNNVFGHLPLDIKIKLIKLSENCPFNHIKSPQTGKCINLSGNTGKKIIQELKLNSGHTYLGK